MPCSGLLDCKTGPRLVVNELTGSAWPLLSMPLHAQLHPYSDSKTDLPSSPAMYKLTRQVTIHFYSRVNIEGPMSFCWTLNRHPWDF